MGIFLKRHETCRLAKIYSVRVCSYSILPNPVPSLPMESINNRTNRCQSRGSQLKAKLVPKPGGEWTKRHISIING